MSVWTKWKAVFTRIEAIENRVKKLEQHASAVKPATESCEHEYLPSENYCCKCGHVPSTPKKEIPCEHVWVTNNPHYRDDIVACVKCNLVKDPQPSPSSEKDEKKHDEKSYCMGWWNAMSACREYGIPTKPNTPPSEITAELYEALTGIIEIGKRDMSNPKYDGYFNGAKSTLDRYRSEYER